MFRSSRAQRDAAPDEVLFEKWEGLGNDFVVIIGRDADGIDWAAAAPELCDRHIGVGADGILLAGDMPASMTVFNADGSRPEMCGNGIRCVVGALATRMQVDVGELDLNTDAGPRRTRYRRVDDRTFEVDVNMGIPSTRPADAGVDLPAADGLTALDAGGVGQGWVMSVGNPHWVFFEPETSSTVAQTGPALEHDPRFAARTNVEFVHRLGDGHYRVDVWERGCGITRACGSGAVAVAASLVAAGHEKTHRPLQIELPGGVLICEVGDNGAVVMRGPARRVYRGVLDRDRLSGAS